MVYEHIALERVDGTAVLRFASGKVNAITPAFLGETDDALLACRQDDAVRALVVTGGDSRFFSFGLDVRFLLRLSRYEMATFLKNLNNLLRRLYHFPKPVVAAVNGHAMAGGLLLSATADYRIGAEGDFSIGLSEVKLEIAAPAASLRLLARQAGAALARELALTGVILSPQEALDRGLWHELVPAKRLQERALRKAAELGPLPRNGIALNKHFLGSGVFDVGNEQARHEDEAWLDAWFAQGAQERLKALVESR